jgi:hypothetical protein
LNSALEVRFTDDQTEKLSAEFKGSAVQNAIVAVEAAVPR